MPVPRSSRRSAQLLVFTVLAFCMVAQAIYAKTSNYKVTSTAARHFSMSVKIADLHGHAAPTFRTARAIIGSVISVPGLELSGESVEPERSLDISQRPVNFRLLRSPPVCL
jgi:hypothetical protein